MIILYIISITVFLAFIGLTYSLFGILPSVSDSYYVYRKYNMQNLFILFCWGTAFPLLIYWLDFLQNDWNFLPFIACAGLLFVGVSPAFKSMELERKVHVISAIICVITAYTWTFLYGSVFLGINFLLLSALLYFILKNNKIYWLELMAFINIYLQLLITSLW